MKNKKILLILCLFTGAFIGSKAQDIPISSVPDAVKNAFTKQYPKASDIDWEKAGANYEVSFDMGRVDHKATYSPSGKTIAYQKDIPNSSLPKGIAANIKSKYPNARIDDVTWINTSGKITYKIDLDGTPDATLWYASNGSFIKEVAD